MTDKLREAAQAVLDRWDSTDWKAAPIAEYMNRLRAALAAAPQPAAVDREALVEVVQGAVLINRYAAEAIADALLARGLRLPGGDETMAWAVVGNNGQILAFTPFVNEQSYETAAKRGETIKRVTIRVVEGGDDAA